MPYFYRHAAVSGLKRPAGLSCLDKLTLIISGTTGREINWSSTNTVNSKIVALTTEVYMKLTVKCTHTVGPLTFAAIFPPLFPLSWHMSYFALIFLAFQSCFKLLVGKYVEDRKMTKLPQPITARHVRINPQYWERGLCMKMDLLGCEARTSGNVNNSRINWQVFLRNP